MLRRLRAAGRGFPDGIGDRQPAREALIASINPDFPITF